MSRSLRFFFFNDTATTEIYTLSLHDALPIFDPAQLVDHQEGRDQGHLQRQHQRAQDHQEQEPVAGKAKLGERSEEHTSELQSLAYLVCRLLLEKKKVTCRSSCRARHKTLATC